jgi:hypothetical protein
MPRQVGSNSSKFPLEELIAQCDLAVRTIDETVISVGRTFEDSSSSQLTSVIQSPLAVLERNIEKLRGVQQTVEDIMRIKDAPFCGTRFTTRQVTDWTFRGVDYFAAIVAVALIIMETSDTASKYLGDTDVPKGFTAALVMVSKVLSAATDYRNKKKLEHEKFLGMLKDVRLKCEKIEEAAAIYNVFRSISNLKTELESAVDPRSQCKDAVKVLKSMPQTKIQADLAKNLKKQLSSAIEIQARELVEARFRAIFDRNNPINIKRRLFERWVDHMTLANKVAKIHKYNRFMILEDKDKMKFTFKQWASVFLNRKKVLDKSRELLQKQSFGTVGSGQPFSALSREPLHKTASQHLSLTSKSSVRKPANLRPTIVRHQSDESIDSQDIDSDEAASMHSSIDDRQSTRRGPDSISSSHSRLNTGREMGRRPSASQSIDSFEGGHPGGVFDSTYTPDGYMIPYDSRQLNSGAGVFPQLPANPRFYPDSRSISMEGASGRNFESLEMQQMDLRGLPQPYVGYSNMSIHSNDSGIVPPDYAMYPGSAPRSVRSGTDTPAALYGTQGSAYSETGSKKSTMSHEREMRVSRTVPLSTAKDVIQDGQLMIEGSLCFASQAAQQGGVLASAAAQQGGVLASTLAQEGIRLNLPPLPIESSSLGGSASDHVVVQMAKD